MFGDYPVEEKYLNMINIEAKVLNKNNIIEITNHFVVIVKKINFNGNIILIQKADLVDKTLKKVYFSFIDIIHNPTEPASFVRIYNNNLFVFEKGNLVYYQKRKKAKYFKNLKKDKYLSENFLTMDLETKIINGTLEPYCVSIFDGKKAYSFYITEYKGSSVELMKAALIFWLKRKYNKYKVYVHNFSYLDGIFIMKAINSIVSSKYIKPIIRDERIINLKIEFYSKNKIKNINIL